MAVLSIESIFGMSVLSVEGLVILVIVLLGFPLIIMETKKYPRMKYMLLGYICVVVASIFATRMIPGTAGITAMSRSVCIMAAGLFFGAGAFVSFRRMEEVIK